MSKYLDKVIKEMADYANMGMPDGEGAMGMGSVSNMGMRGAHKGKAVKAYKLNDILRYRNAAEEEEDFDNMDGESDMGGMDDEFGSDDGMGDESTEELKQFFTDNPEPSDEEIAMYAEEHDMDLQGMRSAVYALIQSLLPDSEEGMDDEFSSDEDMGDGGDEIDFEVSGDTGERPAKNEFEERTYRNRYGRRVSDRRK